MSAKTYLFYVKQNVIVLVCKLKEIKIVAIVIAAVFTMHTSKFQLLFPYAVTRVNLLKKC